MWVDTTDQLLPKSQRRTTGLTSLVQKYGHPIGTLDYTSHRILTSTGKSGLTPISSPLPTPITEERLKNYQKRRFYGFSAAKLEEMGMMAALGDEQMVAELTNPIHPMYVRSQWESLADMPRHRGPVPIRGDEDGYWLPENPRVWQILEPSLRLASLLLTNASQYPWWDALFHGNYSDIVPSRIPSPFDDPANFLVSFHQRSPEQHNTPEAINLLQTRLHAASPVGVVRSNIALELLQPLLRDDLTRAERILAQFRFAATLIHETAHAVWIMLRTGFPSPKPTTEPYFEDEVLCELGWSLEDKIWGGEPLEMVQQHYSRGGPGLPHMGNFKTNWFTDRHTNYAGGTLPLLDYVEPLEDDEEDPFYQFDYWPVPLQWTQHGANATKMAPLIIGTRRFANEPIDDGFQVLVASDLDPITVEENFWEDFTAEQQESVRTENARRAWAMQLCQVISDSAGLLPADPEDEDDADEDEDEGKEAQTLECPRWDEITQYLFANRAPLELALDTMDFDIPEPTLYRYIMDRGGLAITPAEFREFLFTANRKKLFAYTPFPGIGTVTLLPTGWPPATQHTIERNPPPSPFYLQRFHQLLADPQTQLRLYAEFQEFRDVDFEVLRGILNAFESPGDRIPADDFELVVHEFAREDYGGGGGQLVTLGPKGIARLRFEVKEKDRDRWLSKFGREKMVWNEEVMREAEMEERGRNEAEMGDDDSDLVSDVHLEDMEKLEDDDDDSDLEDYVDLEHIEELEGDGMDVDL
ncbi:hypothetical protein V8E51_008376 [Hyaloscypha variabilis]